MIDVENVNSKLEKLEEYVGYPADFDRFARHAAQWVEKSQKE